jgi:hypothetical protein
MVPTASSRGPCRSCGESSNVADLPLDQKSSFECSCALATGARVRYYSVATHTGVAQMLPAFVIGKMVAPGGVAHMPHDSVDGASGPAYCWSIAICAAQRPGKCPLRNMAIDRASTHTPGLRRQQLRCSQTAPSQFRTFVRRAGTGSGQNRSIPRWVVDLIYSQ